MPNRYDSLASVAAARKAVPLRPHDALAWEALGSFYLGVGELEAAEATFLDAISAASGSPGLRYSLARVYQRKEHWEECLSFAREAFRMAPGFGMAHHAAGECLAAMGDASEALENFRDAAGFEPDVEEHHRSLLRAEAEAGNALAQPCKAARENHNKVDWGPECAHDEL